MLSPAIDRGLLGHFLHGAEPSAVGQHALPLPVQSLIYLSLRAILAAGDRGGGARGGMAGRKIPRYSKGWGRGSGERPRDGGGEKRGKAGEARATTEAIETTEKSASKR